MSRLLKAPRRCPPALLPHPLPRTPLQVLMAVARNAGGALCWEKRFAGRGGADRPASINCKHARPAQVQHSAPPAPPVCATVTRRLTQTDQITHAGRGKRHSAAPAGRGHLAPECTVRQATTTGRMRGNCAVQPALPYASTTRFHMLSCAPETAELPATTHICY